jgi:hypothetical protein
VRGQCRSDLVLRDGHLLALDKEDALVPEAAGPVGVDLQVAGDVLADHHGLRQILVQESLDLIFEIPKLIYLPTWRY